MSQVSRGIYVLEQTAAVSPVTSVKLLKPYLLFISWIIQPLLSQTKWDYTWLFPLKNQWHGNGRVSAPSSQMMACTPQTHPCELRISTVIIIIIIFFWKMHSSLFLGLWVGTHLGSRQGITNVAAGAHHLTQKAWECCRNHWAHPHDLPSPCRKANQMITVVSSGLCPC